MAFHRTFALVTLAVLLIGVVLASVDAVQRRPSARYRIWLVVSSATVGIQALVGIALAIHGDRPHSGVHFLLGPLVLVTLPIAKRVASTRSGEQRQAGVLVAGAAIAFVLALGSLVTGGSGS